MPDRVNYVLGVGLRGRLAYISVFRVKEGALAVPQEIYRSVAGSGTEMEIVYDLAEALTVDVPTQALTPLSSITELHHAIVAALSSFPPEDACRVASDLESRVDEELLKIAEAEAEGVEL